MIKIGYFGDGPWAHRAFERIDQDNSINVEFVTVRYDKRDSVLIGMAEDRDIPVHISPDINSDKFINTIKKYDVDLFVSMSFDQIFKPRTIAFPRLKTINCHAGKLPFYRGRNILNWALINDEKEFGITVHYIDDGIDTGDIILQNTYPISDEDDYGTLLERAYVGCADTLYDAIKLLQEGKVKPIRQCTIDPVGLYCGRREVGDEIINWNSSSREIFNFIRAICRPGPMATSSLKGKEIKINRVREITGARPYIGIPGQIIGKTDRGFYVKTRDTFIEVIDHVYEGAIRVGDRLM